jgi:N6-adenosine-specific RNA methylase IME4
MTDAERQQRRYRKLKRERVDPKLTAKQARRAEREAELAGKIQALPQAKFAVIYADPEWRFEVWSEKGQDRAAANHYPTSPIEVIVARDVPSIAADDCALFLWATAPMLPDALAVMDGWGFTYKTHLVWDKELIGTGHWLRSQHELLLIGTRGAFPAPAPGTQLPSLLRSRRREHSRKPDETLDWIDRVYPNLPKIELNRRGPPRAGWDAWGNEVEAASC